MLPLTMLIISMCLILFLGVRLRQSRLARMFTISLVALLEAAVLLLDMFIMKAPKP